MCIVIIDCNHNSSISISISSESGNNHNRDHSHNHSSYYYYRKVREKMDAVTRSISAIIANGFVNINVLV